MFDNKSKNKVQNQNEDQKDNIQDYVKLDKSEFILSKESQVIKNKTLEIDQILIQNELKVEKENAQ